LALTTSITSAGPFRVVDDDEPHAVSSMNTAAVTERQRIRTDKFVEDSDWFMRYSKLLPREKG
jgi:hypothetical protein